MSRIIAGDIGGTKVLLEEREILNGHCEVLRQRRFESGAYASFDLIIEEFVGRGSAVDAICLAVAGPVSSGVASVTNLPWRIAEDELGALLGCERVKVVNDFYSVAHAVPQLSPHDLVQINQGSAGPADPIAVIGAGTGLGEAFLIPEDDQSTGWRVIPSEGGHCDFAPADEKQSGLLVRLRQIHGHVSYERVVSGPGLESVYEFICEGAGQSPAVSRVGESRAAMVSRLAAAGDPQATQAFALFVSVYGAEAGNLALKVLSRGGVFIAGGVAAKNVAQFTSGLFLEAFLNKGRFRGLLEQYPLHIITNTDAGLMGAADLAHAMLSAHRI
ncbi:MAG TPA: glucokinase [Thermoanaerobaculia bacterium]|nr:glucokinase [Thermoanaerobaculia bacterium]